MNSNPVGESSTTGIKVSPASIGCFFLIVSFFVPWINLLGVGVSGYDLTTHVPNAAWLWTIPAAALLAIILGLTGRRHVEVAQVAGGIPIVVLVIALYQNGRELLSGLAFGAYSTLAVGLFLLCALPRMSRKRAPSDAPTEVAKS